MQGISTKKTFYFDTSIFNAAKEGNVIKITQYIKDKGWIDMPDYLGRSMLHYALKNGHIQLANYLQDHGAHFYTQLNFKTADGESKHIAKIVQLATQWLDTHRPTIHKIKDLVNTHIQEKFTTHEEALAWIGILQSPKIAEDALRCYFEALTFSDPEDAFESLKYCEGRTKIVAGRMTIEIALVSGNFDLAIRVQKKVFPDNELIKAQIALMIDEVQKIENFLLEDSTRFSKGIRRGFDSLTKNGCCSQDLTDQLCAQLSGLSCFTVAIEHINSMESRQNRILAKIGLGYCGLIELCSGAKAVVVKQFEEKYKEFNNAVNQYLEQANFQKVLELIACVDSVMLKNWIALDVAKALCEVGFFAQAFKIVEAEYNRMVDEKYQREVDEMISILYVKGQDEWAQRFIDFLS